MGLNGPHHISLCTWRLHVFTDRWGCKCGPRHTVPVGDKLCVHTRDASPRDVGKVCNLCPKVWVWPLPLLMWAHCYMCSICTTSVFTTKWTVVEALLLNYIQSQFQMANFVPYEFSESRRWWIVTNVDVEIQATGDRRQAPLLSATHYASSTSTLHFGQTVLLYKKRQDWGHIQGKIHTAST